jgi:hypothetical protein
LAVVLVAAGSALTAGPAVATSTKPVITQVSPSSGGTAGGTTVTVRGERFDHVREVLFGSAVGTSLHVLSGKKLTVRAPKHTAGTVNVRVETTAGESAETQKDHYSYKVIWTAKEAPLPSHAANPNVALNSVACGSAGSCVAVGSYVDDKNRQQGLVERLAAGHWEGIAAPVPAKANSHPSAQLAAVACSSGGTCVAVGTYLDSDNHVDGLIDTLSHGTWTAKKAPLPTGVTAGSTAQLTAVACHGAGSCAAIGTYTDTNAPVDGQQPLLEAFASGKWSATKAHLPPDAVRTQNAQMSAVTCPATGACSAVGEYDNPEQVGLVETLSNGHWDAVVAQLPGNASTTFSQAVMLGSVACKSTTQCSTVGQYRDTSSGKDGLIETLPVGATSGSEAAVPMDGNPTPDVELSAVSCASSACVSVGSYRDNTSSVAGLIEPLSGPGGTTRAPAPAGASFIDLVSVACPAAGSCATAGFYVDAQAQSQGLLDTQSGTSWHTKSAPLPGNAVTSGSYPELSQIACPSAISCVAIGEYQTGSSVIEGLLEQD